MDIKEMKSKNIRQNLENVFKIEYGKITLFCVCDYVMTSKLK